YDGPANSLDSARAIAMDGAGNVFVTGYSAGTGGDQDYATIKYSGAGVPLWTNRYHGPNGINTATAIAVDAGGNVFVTGVSQICCDSETRDYATIAYSSTGELLWANFYSSGAASGDDRAYAIAVDSGGNVFVTGVAGGSDYA